MPYNGSGEYAFPVNSFNPAVPTIVINPTDWNADVVDLQTALSTALLKDGTQTATQRIPFANGISTDSITEVTSTNGVTIAKVNAQIGSDVASATTTNLTTATGQVVTITGTTTITAITLGDGNMRWVRFGGALTLTHGASLVLPTGANITTAAGDYALFIGYASSVVRCAMYQRLTGGALQGAIAWTTKSGDFSAAATTGYSVDTSSAAVTATLPASPSAGDYVQFNDMAGTWGSNNLILARNGNKIMTLSEDMTVAISNMGFGIVYTGATNGWRIY